MVPGTDDISQTYADLLAQDRPREALRLFLGHVANRAWQDLESTDLWMLDQLCQKGLPQVLEHHTRWLLGQAPQLGQLAGLLQSALDAGYRPAATLEQLAWVRCLLALEAAMRKDLGAAHEQMCRSRPHSGPVPPPNGKLREALRRLELLEGASGGFLKAIFEVYFQCLHDMGRHEMANALAAQVQRLIGRIEADETRSGVVRAMFYNEQQQEGYTRLIHVALSGSPNKDGEIVYARSALDSLDPVTVDASRLAMRAAHAFLRHRGYPDGLQERCIRWEISTLQGEPADLPKSYGGGSLGLPLAVAIISAYLGQVVPDDTALTGALSGASEDAADVLAVDGVEEKVRRALAAGCRRIFLPAGNAAVFSESPTLQHAAQAASATVEPVARLDEACAELFPPQGKGTVGALVVDSVRQVGRILWPSCRDDPQAAKAARSHRTHALVSTAFLAAIFLLEGYVCYLGYASQYPFVTATWRILGATAAAVAGLLLSYGLILASLHHRKQWAWLATIVLTGAAMTGSGLLLAPMLPATSSLREMHHWPLPIGLAKDMFVFWLFSMVLLTNIFAIVTGLEHLIDRHQHVTARLCLPGDSLLEGRLPVRAVPFPWNWGMLAFFVAGVFLFILELVYFAALPPGAAGTNWVISLGMGRDMVLIAATAEAMIFFRVAQAQIHAALA